MASTAPAPEVDPRYAKYRTLPGTVGAPVDGDTFHVSGVIFGELFGSTASWSGRVRLARVDAAPLKNDDKTQNADGVTQAKLLADKLPPGSAISLHVHALDTYGRMVASVTCADGSDLEDYLLENGVPAIGAKEFRLSVPA